MNILFDMETADPDDFITLCFLCSHPDVNLKGITVTPGGRRQVGLVKTVLKQMNLDIPVGARTPNHSKNAVSSYYEKVMGNIKEEDADGLGFEIMANILSKFKNTTILTGAPLPNLGRLFVNYPEVKLKRWVAQGGFAGDNVVPKRYRLDKFNGKEVCPTFNFNGDPKSAKLLLDSPNITKRVCVSKNVCHGVFYDSKMHGKYARVKNMTPGTNLIFKAMSIYLNKNPKGKKLHDPLAACTAINENVCELKEVEIFRKKGQWGSKPKNGSRTWISINYNKELFEDIFLLQNVPNGEVGTTEPMVKHRLNNGT